MKGGRTRALVVGGGIGGLSAAMVLAARGIAVRLLEGADTWGGKAGEVSVDGVSFDTGPSLLTLPHVLETLFEWVGRRLDERVQLRSLSPAFRYHYPDGVVLDVHHDMEETAASVKAVLGGKAADDFVSFLAYAKRIWEASAPHFVFGDAPSVRSLLRRGPGAFLKLPRIDATRSMQSALRRRVRSPHLRKLFARYATYNGSDVRCAPATLHCIAHVELGLGGYGVEGGVHTLVQAMVTICQELGVEMETGARVASIRKVGSRANGVYLEDGRLLEADVVVCNTEARHLFNDLLSKPSESSSPGPSSMSAWNGVFAAKRAGRDAPHSVFFPEQYGAEFAAIFDDRAVPDQPAIYVCNQTLAHGRPGWSDADPLFVMVNAPSVQEGAGEGDWGRIRAQVRERLETRGLLSSGAPLVWERTPARLAQRFPGSDGSLYGEASNSLWSAFRRPANRVDGVRGLYLASGSAHPGGGVPLCVLSGMAAARAVFEDSGQTELATPLRVRG